MKIKLCLTFLVIIFYCILGCISVDDDGTLGLWAWILFCGLALIFIGIIVQTLYSERKKKKNGSQTPEKED